MNSKINQSRRSLLKLGGAAIALVPVAAFAAKNENIRKAMNTGRHAGRRQEVFGLHPLCPGQDADRSGGCKIRR